MCFSAEASFTAAGALIVTGVAGTAFAVKRNRRFLLLNMVAFIFALQQFAEGMLWLGSPILFPRFWGVLFLFFAFFVYPWYLSLSCYFISRKKSIKRQLKWLTVLGILYGAFIFSSVLMTPDLGLEQCQLHIQYHVQLLGIYSLQSDLVNYVLIPMYVLLTCLPCFLSDRRYTNFLGLVILASALFCFWFYASYFVSVWCFYAAVITVATGLVGYFNWRLKVRQLR